MNDIITLFENFEEKSGEPARMTPLAVSDIQDTIERICPGYDPTDKAKWPIIYRGSRHTTDMAVLCDPSATARNAANARNNLYNLLISTYEGYPERLRSLICTTSRQYASGFGKPFIAIPTKGTTVGVCPAMDIWESYKNLEDMDLVGVSTLSSVFGSLLDSLGISNRFTTVAELRDAMDQVQKDAERRSVRVVAFDCYGSPERAYTLLKYSETKGGSLYDNVRELLDPGPAGFKLVKYGDGQPIKPQYTGSRELWFSQPCVLVKLGVFEQVFEMDLSNEV